MCVTWHTLVYSGIPWGLLLELLRIPGHTLVYQGTPEGIPGYASVHPGSRECIYVQN